MGGFGGVDDLKNAEMAKTLKNGLSMIKTNPLNHNWLDFVILLGLTLHQFQKKTAVKEYFLRLFVGISLSYFFNFLHSTRDHTCKQDIS